ncbi:hypothetical protein COO60DRAFT_1528281 [Scenedesmus sp. NREL 46B-D3]|nr:hypothetical protein COO60DRAFT_1528281 [Scenedesmus sp. NREL 46B-D3]
MLATTPHRHRCCLKRQPRTPSPTRTLPAAAGPQRSTAPGARQSHHGTRPAAYNTSCDSHASPAQPLPWHTACWAASQRSAAASAPQSHHGARLPPVQAVRQDAAREPLPAVQPEASRQARLLRPAQVLGSKPAVRACRQQHQQLLAGALRRTTLLLLLLLLLGLAAVLVLLASQLQQLLHAVQHAAACCGDEQP